MSRIAIFPARGNSQRIPKKNIRDFKGKPMLAWPFEAAKASGLFDKIIVSTDCLEVMKVAWDLGCDVFERQADDGSRGTQDVAREVLLAFPEFDEACVIYPCSPLLTEVFLRAGHEILLGDDDGPNPTYFVISVSADPLTDAGCIYWGEAYAFKHQWPLVSPATRLLVLPPERCIDINTPEDWSRAEAMFDALQEKA